MISDLKRYFSYLIKNEAGQQSKNKIIIFFLILLALFLVNKFCFYTLADSNTFQINSALSNVLFTKGISPYSKDIVSILDNYFSTRGGNVITAGTIFHLPIYQLMLYLPFSFIGNVNWSISLWMTVNQGIYLLCVVNCLKIFNWHPKKKIVWIILGASLFVYFGISNFLDMNTSIIQLFFFIMGLGFIFSEKPILAGLMLGFVTIEPFNFFLPLLVVLGFLISRKQLEPITWFFITVILLSLTGIIFDSGWILKFLRNNFLEGSFFPFIDYKQAFLYWFPKFSMSGIVNFIPISLLVWLILEFSRLPKQTANQLYWILGFTVCINPFITMRETNYSSVLYIIPIIFLVYLWENHSFGMVNKVIYGLIGILSVILPLVKLIFPVSVRFIENFHTINLLNSLIIIALLYWTRWWVVIPYDYLTTK